MTKILIIEDEAILREEIVDWLILEGYEVASAGDGVEGVNQAIRFLPDLIVCDIRMPRLDGYGVLLDVQSNSLTQSTPFIFLTAKTTRDDIRKGMDLGADDYLTKPFTHTDLLHAIRTRLNKKAVKDQEYEEQLKLFKDVLAHEREQRLLKAKLVATVSHDFRNPLTSIMSCNTRLRDYAGEMDEKHRLALFNRIETSVRQLQQMLDDMIIVAQMETGNLDFKPELLHPEHYFQHIVDDLQAIYDNSHQIIFESRLSERMTADPRLLRQIVANLIANAIRYSPAGSEILILLDSQDEHYILTVQDQGIGIPKADQPHLFNTFQRGSNVGKVPGTGLGLTIVKRAVELHGGSVSIESQLGVGTTVIVAIPMPRP